MSKGRTLPSDEAKAILDELDRRHAIVRVEGEHRVLTVERDHSTGCLVVCVETQEEFLTRYRAEYHDIRVGYDGYEIYDGRGNNYWRIYDAAPHRAWLHFRLHDGRVLGEVVLSKRRMQLPTGAAALFAIAAAG